MCRNYLCVNQIKLWVCTNLTCLLWGKRNRFLLTTIPTLLKSCVFLSFPLSSENGLRLPTDLSPSSPVLRFDPSQVAASVPEHQCHFIRSGLYLRNICPSSSEEWLDYRATVLGEGGWIGHIFSGLGLYLWRKNKNHWRRLGLNSESSPCSFSSFPNFSSRFCTFVIPYDPILQKTYSKVSHIIFHLGLIIK